MKFLMKIHETRPPSYVPFSKVNAIIFLINIFMVIIMALVVVVVLVVIMVIDMIIKKISKRYFITTSGTIIM